MAEDNGNTKLVGLRASMAAELPQNVISLATRRLIAEREAVPERLTRLYADEDRLLQLYRHASDRVRAKILEFAAQVGGSA